MTRAGELPVLDGRYELRAELGAGSAARVFLAVDRELDREVAVKVLAGTDSDLATLERLREEARLLASLRSPFLVEVHALGTTALGAPYLVLELVRGGSLRARLASQRILAPDRALALFRDVATGLAAAHELGIVHRDVKAENILLGEDDRPRLADFGLAKPADSRIKTRTGIVLGTPQTMAPELFDGAPASPASDVYAWGCVLYEATVGHLPHRGELAELVRARRAGRVDLEPVPPALRGVLAEALAADPGRRPPSGSLACRLGELAGAGDPTPAPVPTPRGLAGPVPARTLALARGGPLDRAAPTRARPREAPGGWGRRAAPALLAVGLGAALLALATGLGRDPGTQPAGPAGTAPEAGAEGEAADREAGALARLWRQRIRDAAPGTWIEGTLRRFVGGDTLVTDSYVQRLAAVRRGEAAGAPGALAAHADPVPLAPAVDEDRLRLLATLRSRRVSPARRIELLEALLPLLHLDGARTALGLPPALGAGTLADALVPRTLEPWPEAAPAPAPTGALAPGRRVTVFTWTRAADRAMPRIDPGAYEASGPEMMILLQEVANSKGGFDPEAHHRAGASVVLPAGSAGSAALAIDLRVANLLAPNVVVLRVGPLRLEWVGDARTDPKGHWDYARPSWFRLRFEVPRELLPDGEVPVEASARPLLGMPRWAGYWLERIEAELRPGPG